MQSKLNGFKDNNFFKQFRIRVFEEIYTNFKDILESSHLLELVLSFIDEATLPLFEKLKERQKYNSLLYKYSSLFIEVLFSSIIVVCKFEAKNGVIDVLKVKAQNMNINLKNIFQMEILLLNEIDFNYNCYTAISFIEMVLPKILNQADYVKYESIMMCINDYFLFCYSGINFMFHVIRTRFVLRL